MDRRVVQWSEGAKRDLDDIVDHIANDSTIDALRVFDRLHEQAHKLAYLPERGRRVRELASSARIGGLQWREVVLRPWRMIYVVQEGIVLVIAVVDCRRDFVAWLSRYLGDDKRPSGN